MSVCVPREHNRERRSHQAVKLIFTILVSYPFAGLLKRLPDTEPWKKNVFLIGSGPSIPPSPTLSR